VKRRTADDIALEITICKFALAAGEIGLTTRDLTTLLDSGLSMDQLVIMWRQSRRGGLSRI